MKTWRCLTWKKKKVPEISIFSFRLSIKLKQSNSRSKQRGFICVPQVHLSKAYCRFLKQCLGWPKTSYELTPIRKENSVFLLLFFLTTLRHNWVTIPVTVTQKWQCPILWRIACVKQTYLPADLHCWMEHEILPLFDLTKQTLVEKYETTSKPLLFEKRLRSKLVRGYQGVILWKIEWVISFRKKD